MPSPRSRQQVAALVDHTLLKPEATPADVAAAVAEALELGVYAICVSPTMVPIAVQARTDSAGPDDLVIVTVAGFPSGAHLCTVKAREAALAVAAGANEVDVVINIGAALAGDLAVVRSEIAEVRSATSTAVLKVIVESAVIADRAGVGILADVCRAAQDAGADFVKTSTGLHPSGGASVRAVAVMAETVGGHLGVKASGGIRTATEALAMLDAGATRLGLSGTRAVLDGLS
ncbi:MAG: deoxyribose-phosphate aldolase [Mycobacteriaceae bacterium]|nr:deoxyribose-phosphate aldolase [Mycobacteriaceae bacterium]